MIRFIRLWIPISRYAFAMGTLHGNLLYTTVKNVGIIVALV
jgi:hypothetical protein